MTMNRGGFSALLAPGFRKIWVDVTDFKEQPLIGRQLVNLKTSKRAFEEERDVDGFGTLAAKTEGGPVSYEDMRDGATKRYTHDMYGLGFRVTEEMYEDDLYGVFGTKMTKALGRSARNNMELVMHAPYNNAFSTSYTGFRSGESLCSTTHTTIRGASFANRNDVDFSLLALQAALEHFESLTNEAGLPAMFTPKIVLHTIQDRWLVHQVLKSQFLPGGNQNDINVVASEGLRPIQSRFLTDTDSWFVIAQEHDVNYYERRALRFTNTDDFDTGDAKYKATIRHTSGFGKWQGIWGSAGAT